MMIKLISNVFILRHSLKINILFNRNITLGFKQYIFKFGCLTIIIVCIYNIYQKQNHKLILVFFSLQSLVITHCVHYKKVYFFVIKIFFNYVGYIVEWPSALKSNVNMSYAQLFTLYHWSCLFTFRYFKRTNKLLQTKFHIYMKRIENVLRQ